MAAEAPRHIEGYVPMDVPLESRLYGLYLGDKAENRSPSVTTTSRDKEWQAVAAAYGDDAVKILELRQGFRTVRQLDQNQIHDQIEPHFGFIQNLTARRIMAEMYVIVTTDERSIGRQIGGHFETDPVKIAHAPTYPMRARTMIDPLLAESFAMQLTDGVVPLDDLGKLSPRDVFKSYLAKEPGYTRQPFVPSQHLKAPRI
jgi:hypothetical protein